MASADGDDDGGPRVDPDVPEDASAPAAPHVPTQQMPLVPTSGAPVGTNAEPLPMISPTSGAPIIRAVARRPPTPLPALGGTDVPSDVPHSARVTVDRRRQAAAKGRATPPGQLPAAPAAAQGPQGPQGPASGPMAPAGAQGRATPVDATLNPAARIPRPRIPGDAPPPSAMAPNPRPADAGAGPALPAGNAGNAGGGSAGSTGGKPAQGQPARAEDGWTSFGPPPAKPGLWRLPAPEPAAAPRVTASGGADAPEAFTVDAPPPAGPRRARHAEPAPDQDRENDGDLKESADRFAGPPRHARPAPATLAAPARSGALLAATSLLPRVVEVDPEGRALPPVLDADSWDDEPPEPISTDDYLGRRRPARLPLRIWLVVGLVLLGLGAAAVVPQLFSPARARETATGPAPVPGDDAPPATSGGELIQPASAGGETATSTATKPGAPAGTTAATLAPTTTTSPRTTTGGPPPGGPFSLTLSAVDTHSYQTWQRQDGVCGGSVVLVGAWGAPAPPGSAPGTLTFSNITVPATGTYNLIITYAITIGGNRNATITLNGAGVNTNGSFGPACTGSRTLSANFTKTSGNTIVFSNPTSTAPSIMRIVISKP